MMTVILLVLMVKMTGKVILRVMILQLQITTMTMISRMTTMMTKVMMVEIAT